jgi:amidohydrolase
MTQIALGPEEFSTRENDLIALRRDFHRHPELSFQEERTAEIAAERMRAAGLEVRSGVAGTGVVAILRGGNPGRTVAWRADMDALPLTESSSLPFASDVPGVMHACGHDGHTAIAIMLAEMLAARRAEIPGTTVFIFQPAEEIGGGAKAMVAAGVLDEPRVEVIYGMHLVTPLPAGQVALRGGAFMAAADPFVIDVRGKGGHGAMPHQAVDPIMVAAHLIIGLQNLMSREVPAKEPAVLSVGRIAAGSKENIIPATAQMEGTLRTLSPSLQRRLHERLPVFVENLARAYQAEAGFALRDGAIPALINAAAESARVQRVATEILGDGAVRSADITTASDDMSHFLAARPGCYFLAGIGSGDRVEAPHHSPRFQMNEAGLLPALQVAAAVVLDALEK